MFDATRDLKTEVDAQGLGRRVTCLACCEVVFELPEKPSDAQRLAEGKRFVLHLELVHEMVALYGRCQDPTCGRFHLSAWPKGQVPAEILQMIRNRE